MGRQRREQAGHSLWTADGDGMNQPRNLPRSRLGSLVLIAAIVGASVATFAYTAGWFSPQRLTPDKIVDAFTPPSWRAARPSAQSRQGHLLHRRVRSERGRSRRSRAPRSSPAASIRLSGASISARPIRTRRMRRSACGAWDCGSRRRTGRNGASAMIDAPFFPVSTPQGFYELLIARRARNRTR